MDILVIFRRIGIKDHYIPATWALSNAMWSVRRNITLYPEEKTALDLALAGF